MAAELVRPAAPSSGGRLPRGDRPARGRTPRVGALLLAVLAARAIDVSRIRTRSCWGGRDARAADRARARPRAGWTLAGSARRLALDAGSGWARRLLLEPRRRRREALVVAPSRSAPPAGQTRALSALPSFSPGGCFRRLRLRPDGAMTDYGAAAVQIANSRPIGLRSNGRGRGVVPVAFLDPPRLGSSRRTASRAPPLRFSAGSDEGLNAPDRAVRARLKRLHPEVAPARSPPRARSPRIHPHLDGWA